MRYWYILILVWISIPTQAQYHFKGNWICATEDISTKAAPLFRKEFETKAFKKASLYIAGLGYYECHINGKAISNTLLNQSFSKYDSRILYDQYDITELIQNGNNSIAVELGNGWYNVQSKTIWNFDKIGWRKSPRLIANLILEYTNGKTDTMATDQSWKWNTGASQFNSLIAGEIYDARKEIKDWKHASFPATRWFDAMVTVSPGGILGAQTMPPVRIIRTIKTKTMKKSGENTYLYDLGENFAGVARLKVTGKAGDSVTLKYSERLYTDGTFDSLHNSGHMIGPETDPKFATDIYVLSGKGQEQYTPGFTYHGFRFVQIQTTGDIRLHKNSIEGLFYSTDFKPIGSFNSSSEMLNKLYAAAIQSYRSNYVGIPTDCPQREKMGWLADAHIICELGLWNFDSASGYRKFLGDIRDVQLADGRLPGIAPTSGIGYNWIDPLDRDMGPAWGSALPIIAWNVFKFSGDTSVLFENYAAVRKYVDFLAVRARASGYLYQTGIPDFLALEETPKAFTSSVFVYHDAVILSKMAGVLGNAADQWAYAALADSVKTAFNREYFDAGSGSYKMKTLTALSGVLVNGLCPDSAVVRVAAELAAGVRQRENKADFGVLGTKWVLSALSDHGYADEAFQLLSNPAAGWGKWIADGHTTLLEGWEPKDQSWNHVFFGDFAAWYYRALAGIKLDERSPGFRRFGVLPVFPAGLNHLAASHRTRFGTIGVNWKRIGSRVRLRVDVPYGTTGEILLKGYERQLKTGRNALWIKE